ncbi:hypothetical protein VNO77_31169 [Canavalia gladiata]|uniref:Uncharacterized protein n=1 Tax=Canavalia gladiata TaxID=3824 RepID=A0AAN9KNR7_CANGL
MASENHHHPHHYFYHQNLNIHHHRTTFLPMLCSRPSIKDVSLPQWKDHPGSLSNDPLSPRIGCMGQVKRHNKIAGLLATKSNTNTSTTISISPSIKYSKLKKLFSGKNLTTTPAPAPIASSCGIRPQVRVNSATVPKNHNHKCSRNENIVPISIENMDPPLPVIKRVQKPEEQRQVDSLWKRRSGGTALKSLKLQQIHHPKHHLQLTSV